MRIDESIIKGYARIARSLPNFRGKHRLGCFLISRIGKLDDWDEPHFFVQLEGGHKILIDARSGTHLGPFFCGTYDTPLIQKICRHIEPEWTLLDVGANVGYYSIPLAKRLKELGGDGVVHSFEPVPANFKSLDASVTKNELRTSINIHQLGLGEKQGIVEIAMTEGGATGNAVITSKKLLEKRSFQNVTEIQIGRLDDVASDLKITRCDFLKVDIEGAEVFFIRGAKQLIEKHLPVVYGEFNSFFIDCNEVETDEAFDFFIGLGYRCFQQVRWTCRFEPLKRYKTGITDLLFLPPSMSEEQVAQWIR